MKYSKSMQIIPVLPPLMDDETLASYFCRLARANNIPFDQMRSTENTSAAAFIPGSFNGIWPYLVNLGEQLDIDPIDLFLDHTTFGQYQMFLTREEHKAFVRRLSDPKADQSANRLNEEEWICGKCAHEDDQRYGFHYVHLDHQLYPRFCDKHLCHTFCTTVENFIDADAEVIPAERLVPFRKLPSLLEVDTKALEWRFLHDRTVICYDDISTIIQANFAPSEFLVMHTALDLEDCEKVFSGKDYSTQLNILSDAYFYLKAGERHGYSLAHSPNILLALFESSVEEIGFENALFPMDELYRYCILRAAKAGYRVESTLQPIMRVRNVKTKQEKIVSPFTILDEEIDS